MTDRRQKLVVQDAEKKIDLLLNEIDTKRLYLYKTGPAASVMLLICTLFCSVILFICSESIMNYCVPVLKDVYSETENIRIRFWISFFAIQYFLWFVSLKYYASMCYHNAEKSLLRKLNSVRDELEGISRNLKDKCDELNSAMKKGDIVFTKNVSSSVAQYDVLKRKIAKQKEFSESQVIKVGVNFFYYASLWGVVLNFAMVRIRLNELKRLQSQDNIEERIYCLILMTLALIVIHYFYLVVGHKKLGIGFYGVSLIAILLMTCFIGACRYIFWIIIIVIGVIAYDRYKTWKDNR